jgi:hypothetical protein
MSSIPIEHVRPDVAATNLARLMERQLGYADGHIDSVALRLFIQAYWGRVSTYAHAIHDGRERTAEAMYGKQTEYGGP